MCKTIGDVMDAVAWVFTTLSLQCDIRVSNTLPTLPKSTHSQQLIKQKQTSTTANKINLIRYVRHSEKCYSILKILYKACTFITAVT